MPADATSHVQHTASHMSASPPLDRRPRIGAREVASSISHADVTVIALDDLVGRACDCPRVPASRKDRAESITHHGLAPVTAHAYQRADRCGLIAPELRTRPRPPHPGREDIDELPGHIATAIVGGWLGSAPGQRPVNESVRTDLARLARLWETGRVILLDE